MVNRLFTKAARPTTERTFAFALHPIDPKADVSKRYPLLGKALTEEQIHFFSQYWPPVFLSNIEGLRSAATGVEAQGWFVSVPYTPRQMMSLPKEQVYKKIIATGRMAERLGAKILGLGAYISIVGDAGMTVSEKLDIPVTTGNSYTVAVVVRSILDASVCMEIDISEATVAVVGATGSIGAASAELLAENAAHVHLVGRRERTLQSVAERCAGHRARITTATDYAKLHQADVILTATSSIGPVIESQHLKPGAVVCDTAVPADVSQEVRKERGDVLIIEGGMVEAPGPVNFNFHFGYPRGKTFACMAETMALALEGRYEDYTVGRLLDVEKIRAIDDIADRHGFHISDFTYRNRAITAAQIERALQRANDLRAGWQPALT